MESFIEKTLHIAREHFLSFGFDEEQITPLLSSAQKDLRSELNKLESLLGEESPDCDKLSLNLHSLKGLLLNMGNKDAADTIIDLRSSILDKDCDATRRAREFFNSL